MEELDPYCLRRGEAATLLSGHPWKRFLVMGDSVAQGIGDSVEGYSDLLWCDRIAAELKTIEPAMEYLNIGKRDLLAAEVLAQQLDRALAFRPDLALVAAGGNDAMRASYKADEVDATMTAIIEPLLALGATVITVGIFDVAYSPSIPDIVRRVVSARMQRLSDRTAALSEQLGTIHINLTGHPAQYDPELYSADGLHGNLRSHSICAAEGIRAIGAYLAGK